ncbi:MAG: arylamine N-acetyltransferase [Coriobacteriales bacterium]|nr:arylamine N-acetyltransferase [Coriobacteriales bacterium]
MYEELYEGLSPQMLDAYLARVGLTDTRLAPTRESLDTLIYAHQLAVPFDTLDSSDFGLVVSLATRDIFEKLITRRRGGYCFELNGLFDKLLGALGFTTRSCLARAVINRDYLPPCLHRMPIVELDGVLHLADVGFGGPLPASSLPLEVGIHTDRLGERFRLSRDAPSSWLLERQTGEAWQRLLLFDDLPRLEVDFVTPNYYCCMAPDSHFVLNRIVNLRTPGGATQIFNTTFKQTTKGETTERPIAEAADLRDLLAQHFGITIHREVSLRRDA